MIKGHQFNKHLVVSVCCGFSTGIGGLVPRRILENCRVVFSYNDSEGGVGAGATGIW